MASPPDIDDVEPHREKDEAPLPNPYDILIAGLDDLVEAGILTPESRVGAEYAAWSKVHGLSTLLLDGPLRDLPEPEVEFAINKVLGG